MVPKEGLSDREGEEVRESTRDGQWQREGVEGEARMKTGSE